MRKRLWAVGVMLVLTVVIFPSFLSYLSAATEDYVGAYTCSFDGDMSGIAIVHVDNWGTLEGVIWSEQEQTVDYVAGWASVDGDGNFSFFSGCGMWVEGAITASGEINGAWDYQTYSGTLTGVQDTGSLDAYVGSYSGRYTGDDTGQWRADIDSDGNITGEMQRSGDTDVDDVYLGMVDSQGNMILITDADTSAKGTIDASNNVSGTWTVEDLSGSFSSQTETNDGSDGGGGGGGGCFLSSLLPDVQSLK